MFLDYSNSPIRNPNITILILHNDIWWNVNCLLIDLSGDGKQQRSKSLLMEVSSSFTSGGSQLDPSKPVSRFPFSVFSLGRKKRLSMLPVTQSELIDRFKKVLPFAVDLILYTGENTVHVQGRQLMWQPCGQITE